MNRLHIIIRDLQKQTKGGMSVLHGMLLSDTGECCDTGQSDIRSDSPNGNEKTGSGVRLKSSLRGDESGQTPSHYASLSLESLVLSPQSPDPPHMM